MLTPERLSEVSWALGKIEDAHSAIEKLIDGETIQQPPTERSLAMREILRWLDDCRRTLEESFS